MPVPRPDMREKRLASAVSSGVGWAGLAGLAAWIAVARAYGLDGSWAALANVAACGVPMLLWSLFVDRVHRNPSTGIDWSQRTPIRDIVDISMVKIAGLWATWGVIAVLYCLGRWYWRGGYLFSMEIFTAIVPFLLVASIPYVIWLDRKLIEPKDGAWHFGTFLIGQPGWDREEIFHHARAWAVKGFFLAFMLSIVPVAYREVVQADASAILASPVSLSLWLITLMFVIDIAFATVGYLLTMKPLDAHIRTANPHMQAWVAALACYPPFQLMNSGGVLDYHPNGAEWTHWMAGHPVLLAVTGALLVLLTAFYAWATVAFGLRFSNLTHRGILTHGPYAWTKHPAYLSKNAFWWLAGLPFLAVGDNVVDMIRNTAILALVSAVYYWRAKTEEKHLGEDPAYLAYAEWMDRHGPIPRLIGWIAGKRRPSAMVPAE